VLISKAKIAFKNPKRIIVWLLFICNKMLVKKINIAGEIFYKYKGDTYPEYLNKGNAISFIEEKAKFYCHGSGIDVGADIWPFPGAVPIRNEKEQNAYKLDRIPDQSLDYVISSHCLEHLDGWQYALKLWISKLKSNGIIFLYLPHRSNKLWNPGGAWGGPGHKWMPTYEAIISYLSNQGIEIIEYNPGRDDCWSFHIVGKKHMSV
jgi:SAM-dependent methyltransferase